MITISALRELSNIFLQEVPGFAGKVLVVDENHLINKLKDRDGIWLCVVYPSAQREGEHNTEIDSNAIWLFVLEKAKTDATDNEEEDQYEMLADMIIQIRDFVEENCSAGCSQYLSRYVPKSTKILPEWQQFGGFNGWSMSLVF